MSERLPGLPPAPPPRAPRASAVATLFRRVHGGVELLWVRREKKLRFAGGFYAFPGGKVDAADRAVPVEGAEGEEAAHVAAAARELFEEVGVLAARGAEAVGVLERHALRRALVDGASWAEALAARGLTVHAEDFPFAGRWVTPPSLPIRFATRFYLVEMPEGQAAEAWPGELEEAAWVTPAEALREWADGKALLHPPALHALRVMAGFEGVREACAQLAAPPHVGPDGVPERVEFQAGVRVFPLQTDTLPPATHTNCYVLGHGELLVVDPGADDAAEVRRLVHALRALEAEGCRVKALVLTHHHADHVGGVAELKRALGVPLWAHARTADRLEVPVDRLLADGDVLELKGEPLQRWHVLHTPGHARGHVCLVDERSRAAVVGDMVAGVGSIIIDPPEGDMTDYLAQLVRLRDLPVRTLYPAHGPPQPDGPGKLQEYLDHRATREALIREALPPDGATLQQVVERAYADTPPFLYPIAERSALAVLEKLAREGRVREAHGRWSPTAG